MTPTHMLNRIQTRPFIPFRLVTADATIYDVRHPELVMVTLGAAYIGCPAPASGSEDSTVRVWHVRTGQELRWRTAVM